MTKLDETIAATEAAIATDAAELARQERIRASAQADRALSAPTSEAAARANGAAIVAGRRAADLRELLESQRAVLTVLRQRRDILADPAFAAETDAKVADAMRLRSDIDAQCAIVGKKADALKAALVVLGGIENKLSLIDRNFDANGHGRASVVSWITDRLAVYFGRGFYPFRDSAPALPGSMFSAPSTVEAHIRTDAAQRAEERVRRQVAAAPEAAPKSGADAA